MFIPVTHPPQAPRTAQTRGGAVWEQTGNRQRGKNNTYSMQLQRICSV